jgi:hypothetical protein
LGGQPGPEAVVDRPLTCYDRAMNCTCGAPASRELLTDFPGNGGMRVPRCGRCADKLALLLVSVRDGTTVITVPLEGR